MERLSDFRAEWLSDAPYIEAHTSGSTGAPKAVRLSKADMRASAEATNAFFDIGAASVLASPLSTAYIAGKMMVVRADVAGCRLIELPVSAEIAVPEGVTVDLLPVVVPQLDSLLRQPGLAARVRNVLIGGSAPSDDVCRRLALAGYRAYISYGMTETCSHVALARADDPGRVYRAMPGIAFETTADGRLVILAPKFSFKRLETTDVVELLDASSFRWRGRADGVINSGGIKLFAEELERLYAPCLKGIAFAVTSRPDARWGRAVVLVAEGDADSIMRLLRAEIADHRLLPKAVVAVEKLPLIPNGKPDRRRLLTL